MLRLSLKTKILLSITLVSLSIGVVVAYTVYALSRSMTTGLKQKALAESTIELARTTSHHFAHAGQLVHAVARDDNVISYLSSSSSAQLRSDVVTTTLEGFVKDNPEYLAIYVLDTEGLCTVSTDDRFVGENYAFRDYYRYALRGSPYTEVAIGATSKELGYYFSYPVESSQGEIIGVAVAKLDPSFIEDKLTSSELAKSSSIMLVDSQGIIFYSTKKDRYLHSLGPLQETEVSKVQSSKRYPIPSVTPLGFEAIHDILRTYTEPMTVSTYDSVDKTYKVVGLTRITPYPYYLVADTPVAELVGSALWLAGLMGGGVFMSVLFSVTIIALSINQFLRPLARITAFTQAVGEGDLEQTLHVATHDELETLAQSLNTMTSRIKDLYTNLDRRIKQQTTELTEKVAALEKAERESAVLLEEVRSKRELSEEQAREMVRYQLAIENVSDHIVITDPDGKVLFANRALERITGFAREEVLGTKAGVKWGKLMEGDFYKKLWDTIKVRKEIYEGEFNNKRKNGEKYIAESKIAPILDDQGKVLFFVGIERDVTKVREVERIKTEFISLASHQLRTPLAGMKWFLEMLLNGDMGTLTDEQKQVVKNIDESNERMIGLINALLNVSRMEAGRVILNLEPSNIEEIVKSLVVDVTSALEKRKQKLVVEVPPDLPMMRVDPKLIREVYMNFLTNAIKYSPEGKTITIKLTRKNDSLLSEIKDQGFGIPEADQEKIFQKFFRATSTAKNDAEGNGLGLYLTKSIIESSGGNVWFKSVEGRGTSFFFTLPIRT